MSATNRGRVAQRYAGYRADALRAASLALRGETRAAFRLTGFTDEVLAAWRAQWLPILVSRPGVQGGWDWEDIRTIFRKDPKRLEIAIWYEDWLCGLAIATLNRTAAAVRALEGHPDPGHPLKGDVVPIALEAATAYAQRTGRAQLWLMEPAQPLVELYKSLGFSLETPKRGRPYCWRKV